MRSKKHIFAALAAMSVMASAASFNVFAAETTTEETEALKRIEDGLKVKIETQKAERKEYLQSLILNAK